MKAYILSVYILTILSLTTLYAEEKKEITMMFGHYPPFYLGVEKDLKTQVTEGIFIDFLNGFEERYGYKIDKICAPRKRLDLMMLSNEAEAFSLNNPMFVNNGAENYLWSDPIFYTKDVVISLKEKPLKFEEIKDLYGKRIGKVLGMGYGELDYQFKSGKILAMDITGGNEIPRFAMLLKVGRIDGFLGNIMAAPYRMKLGGLDPDDFYFAPKPILDFDLMVQINRENLQLQKDLNEFIKESKKNGFIDSIMNKWLK